MVAGDDLRTLDQAVELPNAPGYGLSSRRSTPGRYRSVPVQARGVAGMGSVNNSTSGAEAHLPSAGTGSRQRLRPPPQVGPVGTPRPTVHQVQALNWDYRAGARRRRLEVAEPKDAAIPAVTEAGQGGARQAIGDHDSRRLTGSQGGRRAE